LREANALGLVATMIPAALHPARIQPV